MTHVEENFDLGTLEGGNQLFDYEEPFIDEPVFNDEDEDEDWGNYDEPEDEEDTDV